MNEKLQYATMLEMPLSSVSVTVKPSKKKKRTRKVDAEAVKKELIEKINADNFIPQVEPVSSTEEAQNEEALVPASEQAIEPISETSQTAIVKSVKQRKKRKPFKVSIIAVQFAVIGVLIATIFLTSAINTNSGLNVFFRNVFSGGAVQVVDEREYKDFTPVLSVTEADFSLENGVMTLYNEGSVYSACQGKISSITASENGKYTVEIEHSTNFKTVIGGLDYVYGQVGGAVYSKIPVGYAKEVGATMCFTGADGSIISDYQVVDNSVVWAV